MIMVVVKVDNNDGKQILMTSYWLWMLSGYYCKAANHTDSHCEMPLMVLIVCMIKYIIKLMMVVIKVDSDNDKYIIEFMMVAIKVDSNNDKIYNWIYDGGNNSG